MASQPDAPEGQTRFLRESGKNSRLQRRYFNQAGEPMYSSLLMALMDRAGLNPYSLLHPQKNSPRPATSAAPASSGLEGGGVDGLTVSPGPPQGGMGLNGPGLSPGSSMTPGGLNLAPGSAMQPPSLNAPTPGIGQGQPGVMQGASAPGGLPMGQRGAPPQANPMTKLAGAFGGGGGPRIGGGGGGGLNGGAERLRGNGGGGGGAWPSDPNAIYQNPGASGLPDPNNIGGSQGWNDQDRMMWQSGVSNINNQFDNMANRAAFKTGSNLGPGQNSINAGLEATLARDQGQAMTGLANQVAMQGIQQQDARLNQLMQALGPLMGFPAQAGAGAAQTAAGYGSMPQQQGGLGGLGALAYLFA